MQKKQILALILVPACIFLIVVSTALLVLSANTHAQTPQTLYTLRAWNGQVALFLGEETAPIAQYEIYLALLPPQDVAQLEVGIQTTSHEEALRLLEDLGA